MTRNENNEKAFLSACKLSTGIGVTLLGFMGVALASIILKYPLLFIHDNNLTAIFIIGFVFIGLLTFCGFWGFRQLFQAGNLRTAMKPRYIVLEINIGIVTILLFTFFYWDFLDLWGHVAYSSYNHIIDLFEMYYGDFFQANPWDSFLFPLIILFIVAQLFYILGPYLLKFLFYKTAGQSQLPPKPPAVNELNHKNLFLARTILIGIGVVLLFSMNLPLGAILISYPDIFMFKNSPLIYFFVIGFILIALVVNISLWGFLRLFYGKKANLEKKGTATQPRFIISEILTYISVISILIFTYGLNYVFSINPEQENLFKSFILIASLVNISLWGILCPFYGKKANLEKKRITLRLRFIILEFSIGIFIILFFTMWYRTNYDNLWIFEHYYPLNWWNLWDSLLFQLEMLFITAQCCYVVGPFLLNLYIRSESQIRSQFRGSQEIEKINEPNKFAISKESIPSVKSSSNTITCRYCGAILPNGLKYCSSCGAILYE